MHNIYMVIEPSNHKVFCVLMVYSHECAAEYSQIYVQLLVKNNTEMKKVCLLVWLKLW